MGLTTIKTYGNTMLSYVGALTPPNTHKTLMYLIKESLLYGTDGNKAGPGSWSVVGSSNSVSFGMAGQDYWTDYTKVVHSAGNHSWVVLKQAALGPGPGLQVCFDLNSALTYQCSIIFSRSAGFTGGAINARPTAVADEVVVVAATSVFNNVATVASCGVNCLKSSDGKVTRLFSSIDGAMSYREYWFMEQLNNVESYWTSDFVVGVCATTMAGMVNYSYIFTRQATSSHAGRVTVQGDTTYQLREAASAPSLRYPDYEGKWLVYPCGYLIDTGVNKGRLGSFFDLWAAPARMGNYEYLAAEGGGDFKFVNVGGIVLPWVGTPLMVP